MKSEQDVEAEATRETNAVRLRVVWEYVWTLLVMALLVFSARSSLADWYEVPSGSMLPTIQLGDRIFVNKLAYSLRVPFTSISLVKLGTPQRGDIVVFVYPEDNKTDYVKRLVGLPGDQIEVRDNILYVNGQPMSRHEISQADLPPGAAHDEEATLYKEKIGDVDHFVFERHTDDFPLTVVPPDKYFMMGDNRDNSSDSRAWGFVPQENLRGRALRVVLSFEPSTSWLNFWNPARIRWSRLLQPLNPS
jgi:signal peptidase I